MNDSQKLISLPSDAELENARVGYQVAISMGVGLDQVIWSIFNTMLVANSIVVAGISLFITSQPPSFSIKLPLSIIGLILCLVWYLIVRRHRDYLSYYVMSAREIEERYFSQSFQLLSRGGLFAEGKAVTMQIAGKENIRRMGFWSRLMKGKNASYIIIIMFAAIYIGLLFI